MSPKIQNLIEIFSKFPSVGPRVAGRFVFYLIKKNKIDELINALQDLKKIKVCNFCSNTYDGSDDFCEICSDKTRERNILCIIEKEEDLTAIETTKQYKGLYYILGGTTLTYQKEKRDIEEKIKDLINKIKKTKVKEIILALNPTTEGENTSLLIERRLKDLDIKITRPITGIPRGAELEYADSETISSAFINRK